MEAINIIFLHQLFENGLPVCLIEEFLFFKQYSFHKQKIAFHRVTMRYYEIFLTSKNIEINYVESIQNTSDIPELICI